MAKIITLRRHAHASRRTALRTMHCRTPVIGFAFVLSACGAPSETSVSAEPAVHKSSIAAADHDSAIVLLPPEKYDSMAAGTYPLAYGDAACKALDQRPPRRIKSGDRYRCDLSPELSLIIAILTDSSDAENVAITGVTVLPDVGAAYTLIEGDSLRPPGGAPFVVAQDLDFDGLREVKLLASWRGPGDEDWRIFRWDHSSVRLVPDTVLTRINDPEPLQRSRCLRKYSSGHPATRIYRVSVDCWFGSHLINVYRVRSDPRPGGLYVRVGWALLPGNDTLVLVRVDTVRLRLKR